MRNSEIREDRQRFEYELQQREPAQQRERLQHVENPVYQREEEAAAVTDEYGFTTATKTVNATLNPNTQHGLIL
jgi:hypothetical protein